MKYKIEGFQLSHFGCRNYFLSLCEGSLQDGRVSISFISIIVIQ